MDEAERINVVISYQKLLGNYNSEIHFNVFAEVISYQKLLGNYNCYHANC